MPYGSAGSLVGAVAGCQFGLDSGHILRTIQHICKAEFTKVSSRLGAR